MKMNVNNDAKGNRISKTVTNKNETNGDKFVTTYYVRDPQGNVLAVYEHKHGDSDNGTFTLTEQHLYGAGRLGMKKRDLALNTGNANESPATYYELTNHLGNVMAVISDEASTTDEPTVVSLSDYYPYGMTQPGRNWNANAERYRYGFNSQENVPELEEGHTTALYWEYDGRLGIRWNLDPCPVDGYSNYSVFQRNPILLNDVNGDTSDVTTKSGEFLFSLDDGKKEKSTLTVKQLYDKGIQWFEPQADNYQKLIKLSDTLTKSKSLLHFTWDDIANFSEIDRWMSSYRQGGSGDWKKSKEGADGYLLVSVDGYPYWPDAIGQIPFAVNYYTDVRTKYNNNTTAILKTVEKGMEYGEGFLVGGTPDYSNTYDNYFLLRGAYWASQRYTVGGDGKLHKNNSCSPKKLRWPITPTGSEFYLKKLSK